MYQMGSAKIWLSLCLLHIKFYLNVVALEEQSKIPNFTTHRLLQYLFSTIMSDLSRKEHIYLQKCKLKDRQHAISPNLEILIGKINGIKDTVEHLQARMYDFNRLLL